MVCLSKLGQYPSAGPPTYQIIKVPNGNLTNVMKTSLTIIPNVSSGGPFSLLEMSRLILWYIKDWATLLHFIYFIYFCSLLFILSQNYLSPTISVLAEKTLLKTAYHFLLLLVGFDTLTYRKDYDRSPTLMGHHMLMGGGNSRSLPQNLLHKHCLYSTFC